MNINWWINPKIYNAWMLNAKFTVFHGGRGSGKSYGCSDLCILYALMNPGARILCIRGTAVSIRDSSLELLKKSIYRNNLEDYFIMTELSLTCKNGSRFIFKGAKNYKTIKSTEGINLVWIDEANELVMEAYDFIIPTLRSTNPRFIISFNPEFDTDAVYILFILNKKRNSVVVQINYYDNPLFPETLQEELEEMRETDYLKYKHIYEGELVQAVEGALWKKEYFRYCTDDERNDIENGKHENFKRIVTGVDPAGTSHEKSDLWGIVSSASYQKFKLNEKLIDNYLVLADESGILTPDRAIKTAINLHYRLNGDKIIGEVNYGGDMVKSLLRNQDEIIPYKEVRASRGKLVRAEPIAALYEQGKVKHLKRFPDLEYELLTFTGEGKSPNRMDALVWSLWELSQKITVGTAKIKGV